MKTKIKDELYTLQYCDRDDSHRVEILKRIIVIANLELKQLETKIEEENSAQANEIDNKEIEPYCINCGNDDFPANFVYEDHYANGYKYVCQDCGEFVWLSEREHELFFC